MKNILDSFFEIVIQNVIIFCFSYTKLISQKMYLSVKRRLAKPQEPPKHQLKPIPSKYLYFFGGCVVTAVVIGLVIHNKEELRKGIELIPSNHLG